MAPRLAIFAAIMLLAAASTEARFAPAESAATGRSLLQAVDCSRIANWCVFFCFVTPPRAMTPSQCDTTTQPSPPSLSLSLLLPLAFACGFF